MLITSIPQYVQGLANAKIDLTTTNATVLYTAPSVGDFNISVVNSILVSEDSGNADTITVTLILQGGEILKVTAATANRLHVVASIQEFIQQRVSTSN